MNRLINTMNKPTINRTAPGAEFTRLELAPSILAVQFIEPVIPE